MKKFILIPLSIVLLFTACSTRKEFSPEQTKGEIEINRISLPSDIRSMNRIGATLYNNQFITADGLSKSKLPENFDFINVGANGQVIATNYKDKISIDSKQFDVENVVIVASLKDNILALIYSNNSMEIRDINTKETLFKETSSISLANDTRTTNPYFMGNLVLFPTLDGKILIVSKKTNQTLKTITVDGKDKFNNIIFLNVLKDTETLVAATPNQIIAISANDKKTKSYDIRDITISNSNIYIATIDGKIIKLSPSLEEIAQKKFKYAKIHSLNYYNSHIYAIEREGYTIKLDSNLATSAIYNFDFDNKKRLLAIGNKIYNEDIITLP